MIDQVEELAQIPRDFVHSGMQFINRCQKPDKHEFQSIARAVGIGFVIMGSIGKNISVTSISFEGLISSRYIYPSTTSWLGPHEASVRTKMESLEISTEFWAEEWVEKIRNNSMLLV
ncbi:MAG: Sec61p translocation complex subunit [Claussenomyces sp. TS43310]|nr:MAG: Sec61p translocation complex subunit [Claussenomyces sp. TS43310]